MCLDVSLVPGHSFPDGDEALQIPHRRGTKLVRRGKEVINPDIPFTRQRRTERTERDGSFVIVVQSNSKALTNSAYP